MTATCKIALSLFALLLGLSIYMHFLVGFWGDQDWELLVSRMWLDGKRLYIDHVPVTAPLLFYLYALPVLLSLHIPLLQDYQALVLLSLSAIAVVMVVANRLVALHPGFSTHSKKLQFAALLCFLFIFRMPLVSFGDREHILIVLSFPYLLRWTPTLSGAAISLRLRLLIGTLAAVGFFIKPHCLLLFAAIQLICMLYMRSLRILRSPENITIYIFGALYGLSIWLYTPHYFSLVLPIAYFTYSAIQGFPGGMYQIILCVVFTFIMLRPRIHSPYRKDIYYFTALLPFFYFYARVNNGWAYTYQPLLTALFLTNGFVLWEFLYLRHTATTPTWKPLVGAMLCMINFALETGLNLNYFHDVLTLPCRGDSACPGYYQPFLDEMKASPRAHSFGAIGMDFGLWTRVSKLSGTQWDTRFPQLWMMPRLYIADDDFYNKHVGIFYYAADALAEDLEQKKPDLVFVEVSNTLYTIRRDKPIDWVKDFSAIPDFKEAWKSYIFIRSIDNCMLFQPFEAAALKQPKGPGPKQTLEHTNCHYDVYRRIP